MSRGSKKRLRKQLAAAEARAEFMYDRKMAWQLAYQRLRVACENAIADQQNEMREHLAQYEDGAADG